jgi:hypothetical protein
MALMPRNRRPARLAGKDKNSQAYWEEILRAEGLDMDAGRDPGHRKVAPCGDATDLEAIYAYRVTHTGRVRPKGPGPDADA